MSNIGRGAQIWPAKGSHLSHCMALQSVKCAAKSYLPLVVPRHVVTANTRNVEYYRRRVEIALNFYLRYLGTFMVCFCSVKS